jgi:hypothetical protein
VIWACADADSTITAVAAANNVEIFLIVCSSMGSFLAAENPLRLVRSEQ